MQLAWDDFGAGLSGPKPPADLRPGRIKLGRNPVRGIESSAAACRGLRAERS